MKKLLIILPSALFCLALTNSSTATIGKTASFNDAMVVDCLVDDAYTIKAGAGCKVLMMTCSTNTESLDQLERFKILTGYDSTNFTKFDSN